MDNNLPQRSELRLKNYDYSSAGAYFVTICIKDRKQVLSEIESPIPPRSTAVGAGALDGPQVRLTPMGKTVEKYLLSSQKIPGVKIDQYVIMPDHIHAIIFLDPTKYAEPKHRPSRAPAPTNEMLPHIISTFKRFCNKEFGENIFQRSYMEHIIRDRDDYETRRRYIYENPSRRYCDELYSKK